MCQFYEDQAGRLAASVDEDDARAALNVCLQRPSAALSAVAASDEMKIAKDKADDEAEKAANAMVQCRHQASATVGNCYPLLKGVSRS